MRLSGKVGAYLVSWNSQPVVKKSQPMLSQWGYRDICKSTYLQPARRSTGWQPDQLWRAGFASKAILKKKRPLVVAVSHVHLHIPLNNSNILEKKLITPLTEIKWNTLTLKAGRVYSYVSTPHHTRQTGHLYCPRAKNSSGVRRFAHCSASFNRLPTDVKSLRMNAFKRRLKHLLLLEIA